MNTSRPTFAEINIAALRHNFNRVKELSSNQSKILSIVKANAYGHGAVHIARELENCGNDFLGVATCEEALELREAGIKSPIVVLGGVFKGQYNDIIAYNLIPVVFDVDTAIHLNTLSAQKNIITKIHVKIDTGMGRLGIVPQDIESFFSKLKACKNLIIDGLLTHLSVADQSSQEANRFTAKQIKLFLDATKHIRALGFSPAYLHVANSAAILRKIPPILNLIRPGLMLYGINPCKHYHIDLRPVMSLKTRVIYLKKVPKYYPISYGKSFITKKSTLIATLPVGYADGYCRTLSNKTEVIIRGRRAPVIGLICMDLMMIDVTDVPNVSINDEVTLVGTQGNEAITIDQLAETAGTISYELLCNINRRVPRIYVHKSC